jgi:hypothetical protein
MKNKDLFTALADDNKKNAKLVTITYQETISDALETGFSFQGLKPNEYEFDTAVKENTSYDDALMMAIRLEDKASAFYLDLAERSQSLLATIPRAFRKVANKRKDRKLKLASLAIS